MNILFLDVDGVINDNVSEYSTESICVLKEIIKKHNAKIVMITSNQGNGTTEKRNKVKRKLENLGLEIADFIDPNFEGKILDKKLPSRILGIVHYLKEHDVDKYVILDDDFHNYYRLLCLNHYRTKAFEGLSLKDLPKVKLKPVNLSNISCVEYRYRQLGKYEQVTNDLIKIMKKVYKKKSN